MGIQLFVESADTLMARNAMELLEKENPSMQKLKVKVKETENSIWYSQKKEYGKVANFQKDKYCKPCKSKTQSTAECWRPC